MGMSDRSEGQMTELVEQVAASLVEGWHDLTRHQQYQIKDTILPVLAACIDVLDAEPHRPKRGSNIEAWIKRARDEYPDSKISEGWLAIDSLIDDYRLHADTGTLLSEEVEEQ